MKKTFIVISCFIVVSMLSVMLWGDNNNKKLIDGSENMYLLITIHEDLLEDDKFPEILSMYYLSRSRGGFDSVMAGLSDRKVRKRLKEILQDWNILEIIEKNVLNEMHKELSEKVLNDKEELSKEMFILRDGEIEDYHIIKDRYGSDLIFILRIKSCLYTYPGPSIKTEAKIFSIPNDEVIFHKEIAVYEELPVEELYEDGAGDKIKKAFADLSIKTCKIMLSEFDIIQYPHTTKELQDIKLHDLKRGMDKYSDQNDILRWQKVNLTKEEILALQEAKEKEKKKGRSLMLNRRHRR